MRSRLQYGYIVDWRERWECVALSNKNEKDIIKTVLNVKVEIELALSNIWMTRAISMAFNGES